MSLSPPIRKTDHPVCSLYPRWSLVLCLLAAFSAVAMPFTTGPRSSADSGQRRVLSEQTGSVAIRNGERVRVRLDQGDVRVHTQANGTVQYRLRIEGPAASSSASVPRYQISARSTSEGALVTGRALDSRNSAHFWITLELDLPRPTPLEVSTQGGGIEVQDIDGRLVCDTAGGRIRVGKVNSAARLETAGGDIVVEGVSGDLYANTGGGHILAGTIGGSATLTSGGGHIRVVSVEGLARMDTGGGNIFLDHAGGRLIASSGGGRIMVGEASGELEARTGGGGIRIWHLEGPARVESGGGSIFLAGVTSPVRASTAAGGITASFARPGAAPVVAPGPSEPPHATLGELQSSGGDIIVFLPVDLGLTLDALIEGGENFHIVVDPALALKLKSNGLATGRSLRAEGPLAGGGPLLRLRANSGNILLRPVNAAAAELRQAIPPPPPVPHPAPLPPNPPGAPGLDASAASLEQAIAQMQRQLEARQGELESFAAAQEFLAKQLAQQAAQRDARRRYDRAGGGETGEAANVDYDWSADQLSQMEDLREKLASLFTDRVVLPAEQLRPRLIHRVDPVYPDSARQSGAEGPVRLRVAIARDGTVEDAMALSGNPELAAAAVAAVRRWRYRPTILNGKPVPVLTVLTVTFHRP